MALFDPATLNKQIESYVATIPPGKKIVLLGEASLRKKEVTLALAVKLNDVFTAYTKVSKDPTGFEATGGVKASFLFEEEEDGFSYSELVAFFKSRGYGWIRAHLDAFKLSRGFDVELLR